MFEYILESSKKSKKENEKINIYDVPFIFSQPFEKDIDLNYIKNKIESLTPEYFFDNVDGFFVGYVEEFFKDGREYNAMFKDGAIYISPDQDNEADLLDDILHEVAHAVEKTHEDQIYGDGRLEREFIYKRKYLYYLLGDKEYDIEAYANPEYDYEFDQHLYKNVGYNTLRGVSAELFYSPYAITALREYWANGFENYLLGVRGKLKEISPVLYNKVDQFFE
jgi:hypothetical protein|tara:strand:+ start:3409 stop:4074 length:666 start_codon:yes stop_codon:yes gene_type:complete